MNVKNTKEYLRRSKASPTIVLLATAWLMVTPCFGQSRDFTAEPASIEGTLRGFAVLGQLPNRVQPARGLTRNPRRSFYTSEQYRQMKAAAHQTLQGLGLPQVSTPAPVSSYTPSAILSFLPPSTFDEASCGNVRFANGGLAVSANFLLEAGSSCVKVLNPSTGAVIAGPMSLSTFFGSSNSTSSVRALFDPVNGRFLVSAEDYQNNRIFVAASQSSDPTQGWNIYSFPMAGTCSPGSGDNPKMGQTYQESGDPQGAIYLSWDIYCPPNGPSNFVGALSKSLVYAGTPVTTINGFQGLSMNGVHVDGVQPANVMNPGDHPRGEFLLNSFNLRFGGGSCVSGCNGVVVWNFFNGIPASGSSQSITGVIVPTANTYYLAPNAPQPGCAVNTCGPATGETDMGGEVTYSAGSLFGALNNGMGILAVEVEPEINDAGAVIAGLMRNEICFACGGFANGGQAYDAAIQPDSERNWVMVYNYSAPATAGCVPDPTLCIYPSTAFLTRRVTQAQNTVDNNGSILALGQGYYSQFNPQGRNRWADYSAVAPSYGLPNTFWFDGEFAESNGTWGTAVGEAGYTSSTQP